MRYIQLIITITIFILLFSIINNQNEQLDNQRDSKIQFKNIIYSIEQLESKTAKTDTLKVKLIDILKDLAEVE